jgi:NADPH-dependent ferric siderophore reductase
VDVERYHLILATAGRPVMHGWWADRATADRKFTAWIGGEHSSVDGARITLIDELDGTVLTTWPKGL